MQSPAEVAQTFLTRWAEDPAGTMAAMVTPDIVYTLNVTPEAIQIGGETVGWDAVNAKMTGIREVFDYLVYKPRILVPTRKVRAQHLRSPSSGRCCGRAVWVPIARAVGRQLDPVAAGSYARRWASSPVSTAG